MINRRNFLQSAAATSALVGLGELSFLSKLPQVSAAEAKLDPKVVRFLPEIEPLVRFIEDTPRERLLEEVGMRVRRGTSYRDLLTAVLLAGVRNIQPRPVGFKFHAVLVINSAHLASLSAPDQDRWLPLFWALDSFKSSQQQDHDAKEGDWTMAPVDESAVPAAHKAKEAFIKAMENWDAAAADTAIAGFARTAGAHEVFETFARIGARDFRDIGHKAIYVANSWRALQSIGWQHAEPVLRSLAYALLEHQGENPSKGDAEPDRPGRRNLELVRQIRSDWRDGKPSAEATRELLATLREASFEDATKKTIELLNRGVSPASIWDALFDGAGELLMRNPGIVALHAVTSTNALQFAYQTSGNDETRRFLLLQNVAFLTLFRGKPAGKGVMIDEFEPAKLESSNPIEEIFAAVSGDRNMAAGKVLRYLDDGSNAKAFVDAARRLLFVKGNNAHDYKFSSAVLEDYQNVSPRWRNRYLAASVFNLRGSGHDDNDLVKRTRAALV